jgi:hypothetical protein
MKYAMNPCIKIKMAVPVSSEEYKYIDPKGPSEVQGCRVDLSC